MLDEIVVRQCSPTLAGLKTGNLFPVRFDSQDQIKTDIRDLNKRLMDKGLRVVPVRYTDGKALLYLYRPACLRKDLADGEAAALLSQMGYRVSCPEQCIVKLIHKLSTGESFPHEVGLFLGYPPEDVKGFIQNKACGCKCVGCWKVYGDAQEAQKTFCKFKKCTRLYCEQWKRGKSIEQLAVAV